MNLVLYWFQIGVSTIIPANPTNPYTAFSGSFLILISLTSPVLSSVAALLTIFLVALVDWKLTNKPLTSASIYGGILIVIAFLLLSWSTYRELDDDRRKRLTDSGPDSESDV